MGRLDVLIYIPTIQCGLSFTERHFDVIYGYFSRSSCLSGPELQMLFRCRTITKMRICIDSTGGKKDLVCKNPNVCTLNEYKAYIVRNYNGAKGKDLCIFPKEKFFMRSIKNKIILEWENKYWYSILSFVLLSYTGSRGGIQEL